MIKALYRRCFVSSMALFGVVAVLGAPKKW